MSALAERTYRDPDTGQREAIAEVWWPGSRLHLIPDFAASTLCGEDTSDGAGHPVDGHCRPDLWAGGMPAARCSHCEREAAKRAVR